MGGRVIKKKLRNNLFTYYLINIYHVVVGKIHPIILSDEKAVKRYYKKLSNKELDLSNPRAFSEKQQWYKLNDYYPLKAQCADKYEVREYIKGCGYEELLNELYGVYDDIKQLDINKLPEKFVLKAAHGSAKNLIVKDKKQINWFLWKKIMKVWLHQNIYWSGREWVYKDLKHRIIAEKYLEDETGELRDYKFFCFNGEPQFMQLEIGRFLKNSTRNFYDMKWNLMPFGKVLPHNPNIVVPKPAAFEKMQKIARDLSKPFSFVRVDLYQVGETVYFGELTFFPASGAPDFVPSEYDRVVGDMWTL